MNPYTKNLNRIEFVVTYACTGRCRHCSEGEHTIQGGHMDGGLAAEIVRKVCGQYSIASLMTFGGEPLLYPEVVCQIHAAAKEMNIPDRSIITNGFFSRDAGVIQDTADRLAQSGVTGLLLSADAFHQETIPLEPVKMFAGALLSKGVPLRVQPAWLCDKNPSNPYNRRTIEILKEFEEMGISCADGNIIFPAGNALTYLSEYFDKDNLPVNPYEDDPEDVRCISLKPNGDVLGGNVYRTGILDIIADYRPLPARKI